MSKIRVLDLETTIHNRGDKAIGNNKASPHDPKNKIVLVGDYALYEDNMVICRSDGNVIDGSLSSRINDSKAQMLVGHNIKFDLLYGMKHPVWQLDISQITVWDTQLAEYLLTGQESTWASLDELSKKYGGTLKDERIKEMWENGIDTEDIDPDILIPYLKADLTNTAIVFKAQLELARKKNMLPLIRSQMDALLATTEMEYNGMYFDKPEALKQAGLLGGKIAGLTVSIEDTMRPDLPKEIVPNANSDDHISLVLFGGQVAVTRDRGIVDDDGNPVLYKTGAKKGTQKFRKMKEWEQVDGYKLDPANYDSKLTKKADIYTVNEEVLRNIAGPYPSTDDIHKFVTKILKLRKLSKDYKTYYIGYSNLVWPHDSCIHPQFNHCATTTGRLSHSNPNLGNVSHKG